MDSTLKQVLAHLYEMSTELDRLGAENERLSKENERLRRAITAIPPPSGGNDQPVFQHAIDTLADSVPNDQQGE